MVIGVSIAPGATAFDAGSRPGPLHREKPCHRDDSGLGRAVPGTIGTARSADIEARLTTEGATGGGRRFNARRSATV